MRFEVDERILADGSVYRPLSERSLATTLDALSTAIVIGYEVAARLGMMAGRGFHARGFHATGVVGPIAAAAAAGHLMRLDASRLADAMGLATSMSSGLLAFLGDGGWSKWMHTGWSAHGGLIAAQLANTGFRGADAACCPYPAQLWARRRRDARREDHQFGRAAEGNQQPWTKGPCSCRSSNLRRCAPGRRSKT
jgi:hypothetical protein